MPLPTPIDVAEALTKSKPALSRIEVRTELDGRVAEFGRRFWDLVQDRSAVARDWFMANEMQSVEYDDRYLFNPLSVSLFTSVLRGLPRNLSERAKVTIRTMADKPAGYGTASPSTIFDDWRNVATRDRVLKACIADAGFSAALETARRQMLPHGRSLRVRNARGSTLEIVLDQGFGYWRSRGGSFDFAADPLNQATVIVRGNAEVIGSSFHPTAIIVEAREP